ncbi:MAG: hypothetical protein GXP62_02520, partial [Oligoflexia bacterium]|nr:hypothetical protein [Oligoflexia bacterium]
MARAAETHARSRFLGSDTSLAVGLYLLTVAIYLLTGPGRIGMIDGQYRFEVARSLLDLGLPLVRDGKLPDQFALQGVDGVVSTYGATVSVLAVPLLWVGRLLGLGSLDAQQTVFSFLCGLFGAAIVPVQFWLHRALGLARKPAVAWALVTAFCTLLFVSSTTVFDQSMHALWILVAVGCTWLAGRRGSLRLAAVAGCALALLVNHQEVYAGLAPFVLLGLVEPGGASRRRKLAVAGVVLAGLGLGLLLWAGWNEWRLGEVLRSGKAEGGYNIASGPLQAALSLVFSPGKGALWYSPPLVIGLLGLAGLWRQARGLALAVILTAAALLGMYALQPFFSGDWCWGPRYMVPSLVLIGLAMPFARVSPVLVRAVVGAGLIVQLLGLSLDHHRFFQDRGLVGAVTDTDPGYYWHASALAARPAEI